MQTSFRTLISQKSSEVNDVLGSLRKWIIGVACFSGVINLLALTGSIFMLQVYDRVLSSHSIPTLIVLLLIVCIAYIFQGWLDLIRSRILTRMGVQVNTLLSKRIFYIFLKLPLLRTRLSNQGSEPLRDLEKVQTFLAGQGMIALSDLPWIPIYLIFVFILNPWLGWLATFGAVTLILLTIITDRLTAEPIKAKTLENRKRLILENSAWRNAEAVHAMGFRSAFINRWLETNKSCLEADVGANDISGGLGAFSKVFRALLQSLVLALAAYLVILGEMTGGAIIAASITSARALAPIDQAISQWKFFIAARESKKRLEFLLRSFPPEKKTLTLSPPSQKLVLDNVSIQIPEDKKTILKHISFSLEAGHGLGIIGPSAAGKSTLARAILGLWPVASGSIRLDGATLDQWDPEDLGKYIGYVPQDIELFEGTIAETISRFEENPNAEDIVAAAQAARVHDMILHLENGYETLLGREGVPLSSGQRQRVALARSLYKNPFMVVLDEPNSNLDREGEEALTQAMLSIRQRGGIVIIVAHRPNAIRAVDFIAVMANGMVHSFGPKDEILKSLHASSQKSSASSEERDSMPSEPK